MVIAEKHVVQRTHDPLPAIQEFTPVVESLACAEQPVLHLPSVTSGVPKSPHVGYAEHSVE